MTNSEMLQAAFTALESGDSQLAGEYLADDFVFRGTLPQPLDKKRYLALTAALKRGFPDFALNLRVIRETDEHRVVGTIDPIGTHKDVFQLPGMTPIQPTGQCVALPRHRIEFILSEGKIIEAQVDSPSQGGLAGMLAFMGVDLAQEHPEGYFEGK
jgi:hypothetical protein